MRWGVVSKRTVGGQGLLCVRAGAAEDIQPPSIHETPHASCIESPLGVGEGDVEEEVDWEHEGAAHGRCRCHGHLTKRKAHTRRAHPFCGG